MATKRPLVNNAGTLNEIATGDTLLASGFSIPSGTSTQFLKADGTTDNTTYTVNSEVTRASIRPSLLLDFANSKTLDPRIIFTRNSIASYYGKDGLLKTAAINSPRFDHNPTTGESLGLLIEEQRTNLLTYSENFDGGAFWTTGAATLAPNSIISPDGKYNAYKLIDNATLAIHRAVYAGATVVSGNTYTFSAYIKQSNLTKVFLQLSNTGFSPKGYAIFDLVAGSVLSYTGILNSGIVLLTNGWARCYISALATGTVGNADIGTIDASGNSVYTGDGTSGIYIWGAQLEVGAFATSYIPSTDTFTSRATTGTYIGSNGLIQTAAINTARYNYNPLNLALSPKLLLESASTNLLTYSEQFDNAAWTNQTVTIVANNTIAPDGTTTADKIVATGAGYLFHGAAISINTTYTYSIFLKAGTSPRVMLSFSDNSDSGCTFYVDCTTWTLVVGAFGGWSNPTYTVIDVGNSWKRISVTATSNNNDVGTTCYCHPIGVTGNATAGDYFYAWGAQLETGASATSYIPTTSAQVTRAADVSSSAQSTRIADSASITGTNFSNWYRQDEGTFATKSESNYSTSSATEQIIYNVSDNSTSNFLNGSRINASNRFYGTTNAISQFDLTSGTYTTQSLHSNTYKLNSINTSYNGATVTTDTSAIIPSVNKITLGASTTGNYLNGHISKLAYYPKQLTNAELITLSTV